MSNPLPLKLRSTMVRGAILEHMVAIRPVMLMASTTVTSVTQPLVPAWVSATEVTGARCVVLRI